MNKKLLSILVLILIFVLLLGCQQQEQTQPQDDNQEQNVQNTTGYTNGTYISYSNATDNGYAYARVNIEDNNISDVEIWEITSKGNKKDYDTYKYEPSVKAQEKMTNRFEEANSADVDVYSGATDSSNKFIEAVSNALKMASGDTEGKYFNGKFQGSSEDASQYGYAVALITIENDDITAAELKEVTTGGDFRDFAQYDHGPSVNANKKMAERFVENDTADVDTYTGATQSSKKYIDAVKDALLHASTSTDNLRERKQDIDDN